MKTNLVTGITGQDGAYIAHNLLASGQRVVGCYRRTSSDNFWRLRELNILEHDNLILADYDLTDLGSAIRLLETYEPQFVYNLAAQSFVAVSFSQPHATADATAKGALNMLEAIRIVDSKIRFYQASSSEMFGKVQTVPQNEATPFYPRSPYGVAKLYAHWMTINYREAYDIFACSGILFNHESPLRGLEFVTRKITAAAAKIAKQQQQVLELGNLDAERDWGFAGDYVAGMRLMLEAEKPDSYVLATGVKATVRDFVQLSFAAAGIDLEFHGEGVEEQGFDREGVVRVRVNPEFFRPAEVETLLGDFAKAKSELGWSPKVDLKGLCEMMTHRDLERC